MDADSSIITADSVTGHESDSESELWDHFNFPHLTPEEDVQLTIALQGGTTANQSHMCSVVQGMTVHKSESGPLFSPPPYMPEFHEDNNLQPVNNIFLINNDSVIPISSTQRHFYVVIDGVYHVIRQM